MCKILQNKWPWFLQLSGMKKKRGRATVTDWETTEIYQLNSACGHCLDLIWTTCKKTFWRQWGKCGCALSISWYLEILILLGMIISVWLKEKRFYVLEIHIYLRNGKTPYLHLNSPGKEKRIGKESWEVDWQNVDNYWSRVVCIGFFVFWGSSLF